MYDFLHELLMDRGGGVLFTCFSPFHLGWIAAAVAAAFLLRRAKQVERVLNLVVGLYALDFFLMPLAYGYIDIEKLPFHVCTAMCLMCFFGRYSPRLAKYRQSFILLGFLSNFVYLCYPAGVMWHRVSPLSYRVIQTLLFHALMTVYGFVALWENPPRPGRRELAVLTAMTAWAWLGNWVYNGTSEGYDHFFNWFFVVRDPFYLLPETIASWIMPPVNILIFFIAEHLICALLRRLRKS